MSFRLFIYPINYVSHTVTFRKHVRSSRFGFNVQIFYVNNIDLTYFEKEKHENVLFGYNLKYVTNNVPVLHIILAYNKDI